MMIRGICMWLGGKDAGIYLGRSRDWVEIRAIPWSDEPVPGRIRYGLDADNGGHRYYVPDLDAMVLKGKRWTLRHARG
jgi:hypothetical protein